MWMLWEIKVSTKLVEWQARPCEVGVRLTSEDALEILLFRVFED
jgi:hypothetical protein